MSSKLQSLVSSHGLSQSKLAEVIGVSRPTVSKILSGERELQMSEAKSLAETLGISTAEIYGDMIPVAVKLKPDESKKTERQEERVILSSANVDKFENAFLYITQKIGALPNVGQTVLYKILYFCDFDYYEKYEEQLTGARYQRNHYGPTPIEFGEILKQMVVEKKIEVVKSSFFNHEQTKYMPRVAPDLSVFSGQELNHIDEVIEKLKNKTAKELSDLSHKDVPWITTSEGKIIDYESVFYRTAETSVRDYGNETA